MQVVADGLSKVFGTTTVFTDLSLRIPEGETSAIVAPSGAGKSTLLAMLAGLEPASGGSVRHVAGHVPGPPDPRNVAWVTQGNNALSGRTVIDNALIGALAGGISLATARDIAQTALERVGLGSRLHDRARELSGGELQRLSLARAVASRRSVIFADEPSAHLDEGNTRRLSRIIEELPPGTTVVIATHDPLLMHAAHARYDLRARTWSRT
jgi:putative ABC transport system ATP-binding protein